MNTRGASALLILMAVSASCDAEYLHTVGDATYTARKASDCFEISDRAAAECVTHFFEASEKALEATFDGIRGRLVRDRQLFEETQAKWLSFKHSECEVRSVSAQAYRDRHNE